MKKYKPKLVRDFKIYEDKTVILNKPIYFVGSEEADRTLKIDTTKLQFFKDIIKIIDGTRTIVEIETEVAINGYDIDFNSFLELLSRNGLIEGGEVVSNSEVDLLSKTILDFPIKSKEKNIHTNLKYFIIINYFFIIGLLVFTSINFYDFQPMKLDYRFLIHMIPLTILTIIVHELGHLFYAIANNISVDRIRLALMFGLVPMVYIKYKNLYFISSNKRLVLILSGVLANLQLALIGFMYYFYTNNNIAISIIYVNIGFIIGNLYPHQVTDGYFALCTILGKYNLRLEAIYYIFNIKKRKKDLKTLALVIIYLCLMVMSVSAVGVMIYKALTQFINVDIDKYYWYIVIGIFIFMAIRFYIQIRDLKMRISNRSL